MAPKKKSSRAAQLQPQPVHSDYDTDTANITDSAPAMSLPPPRTNTELNLAVLRRYLPDIERIIAIAPFAVVYLFSPESQQWEKSGHEGTLFVCQLSPAELGYSRYNVIMLNRKGLDNFITELISGDNVEIAEQYVILQVRSEDGTPNIYGLWIFSDDDAPDTRQVVANAIQQCAVRAEMARDGALGNGNSQPEAHHDSLHTVPSYNLDGAVDSESALVPEQTQLQPAGQQIDLLSLFNKSTDLPISQSEHLHQNAAPPTVSLPLDSQPQPQPTRFTSTADTDFFRSLRSPAVAPQQQSQRPAQQSMLLDLFKSAQKS